MKYNSKIIEIFVITRCINRDVNKVIAGAVFDKNANYIIIHDSKILYGLGTYNTSIAPRFLEKKVNRYLRERKNK